MLKMFVLIIMTTVNSGLEVEQVGRYMSQAECQAEGKHIVEAFKRAYTGPTQPAGQELMTTRCTPYWVESAGAEGSGDNPVDRGFRKQ